MSLADRSLRKGLWRLAAIIVLVPLAAATSAEKKTAPDYERDIKPLLTRKCYSCHGALKQNGNLRLDTKAVMLRGGDSGPAVVPGKPQESPLIEAVTGDGFLRRMPLESAPLTAEEIALLVKWIESGAKAPDEPLPPDPREYWAFQPPVRPKVPQVKADWIRNPIDAFLAAEHAKQGLKPVGPADRRTLLRRVYLDLVGVPPTPAEMKDFLADNSPQAYERVVDRLLDSPLYGQRWGRHWMDVWRYSDWDGYKKEVRNSQPHIWRWRDWIVDSLNADKPYDRMVVEMLAGDEAAPGDPKTLRATGFLVRNWYKFNRNVWLENTVEHTSKAFLGITMNCAKCHDHFFDPVSQKEYYRFRAFFEPHDVRTDRVPGQPDMNKAGLVRVYDAKADTPTYLFERGDESKPLKEHPLPPGVPQILSQDKLEIAAVPLPRKAYYPGAQQFIREEAQARAQREWQDAKSKLASAKKKLAAGAQDPQAQAQVTIAQARLAAAQAAVEAVEARLAADAAAISEPNPANAGELAQAAVMAERRLTLAQREAALAEAQWQAAQAKQAHEQAQAAVKANEDEAKKPQLDKQLKQAAKKLADAEKKQQQAQKARDDAQAKLEKPADGNYTRFGKSYPQQSTGRRLALARWIASERNPLASRVAVNHIWLRHFGEGLVPSMFDFGHNGKPPINQPLLDWLATEFVARGWEMKSLHKLIVTSGAYRLSSADGGPEDPNRKQDPENLYLWKMNTRRMEAEVVRDSVLQVAGNLDTRHGGPDLDPAQGLTNNRRSLYFRHSKEKKVEFLDLFDRANVVECYRRTASIVPQQALALANSSLCLKQSRLLAKELTGEAGAPWQESQPRFVQAAYERILNRPPSEAELRRCLEFLQTQAQRLAEPGKLTRFNAGKPAGVAASQDPQQRARENLVHVLFNHNDFVTIR